MKRNAHTLVGFRRGVGGATTRCSSRSCGARSGAGSRGSQPASRQKRKQERATAQEHDENPGFSLEDLFPAVYKPAKLVRAPLFFSSRRTPDDRVAPAQAEGESLARVDRGRERQRGDRGSVLENSVLVGGILVVSRLCRHLKDGSLALEVRVDFPGKHHGSFGPTRRRSR